MASSAARDGQTALALRLTKHLAPADEKDDGVVAPGKNVAFSPVSVHAGLAIVAAGARGATQAQLLHFLGAPTAEDLAALGRRIAERILADRADSGGPRVLYGGGVWIDAARGALEEAFQEVAAKSYKSDARTVSFIHQPEEAVQMINTWVKKATNDLIDSILSVSDITADTDLVLANAVYFKGKWLNPFSPLTTTRSKFHLLEGGVVEANFMSKSEPMLVSCLDGFKVLKLPYKEGHADADAIYPIDAIDADLIYPLKRRRRHEDTGTQFSMFVFLPDKPRGIADMVDVITASPGYLYSLLPTETNRSSSSSSRQYVKLQLPKFEISFDWKEMKSDLRRLGLMLPFSPEVSDLRGMYAEEDGRPTFLTKVAHKAIVKVNEEGTEAAAVMGSLRGGGAPEAEFVADHPFTFLIMEELSGVIVFAGHVLDPTSK